MHLFLVLILSLLLCRFLGNCFTSEVTPDETQSYLSSFVEGMTTNRRSQTKVPSAKKSSYDNKPLIENDNTTGPIVGAYVGDNKMPMGDYNSAYYGEEESDDEETVVEGMTSRGSSGSSSIKTFSGSNGNKASVISGPKGNKYAVTSTESNSSSNDDVNTYDDDNYSYNTASEENNYNNTSSQTTVKTYKKSEIPEGDEDLYILKSQVVPPVCPACPTSASCPREKPCPACPPCARCPEPAFTCKKVPNYSSTNDQYLPKPVLSDFSEFGM